MQVMKEHREELLTLTMKLQRDEGLEIGAASGGIEVLKAR
jgi:hypothetical protein